MANKLLGVATIMSAMPGAADVPIGFGILVDSHHIITCAHVLQCALGRGKWSQQPIRAGETFRVRWPYCNDVEITASFVPENYCPPPRNEDELNGKLDFAILRATVPVPTGPAVFSARVRYDDVHKLFGYPETVRPPQQVPIPARPGRLPRGELAEVRFVGPIPPDLFQLNRYLPSSEAASPGYSGAGVLASGRWLKSDWQAVGMFLATRNDQKQGLLSYCRDSEILQLLSLPICKLQFAFGEEKELERVARIAIAITLLTCTAVASGVSPLARPLLYAVLIGLPLCAYAFVLVRMLR